MPRASCLSGLLAWPTALPRPAATCRDLSRLHAHDIKAGFTKTIGQVLGQRAGLQSDLMDRLGKATLSKRPARVTHGRSRK